MDYPAKREHDKTAIGQVDAGAHRSQSPMRIMGTAKIRLKSDMNTTNGKDSRKSLRLIHDTATPAVINLNEHIGKSSSDVSLSGNYHITSSWIIGTGGRISIISVAYLCDCFDDRQI